jgi:hypothetical protein
VSEKEDCQITVTQVHCSITQKKAAKFFQIKFFILKFCQPKLLSRPNAVAAVVLLYFLALFLFFLIIHQTINFMERKEAIFLL